MSVALIDHKLEFDPSCLVIRALTANDFADYRALRRKILDIGDGKYFSDSYDRENGFSNDNQWREWCTSNKMHCTIGMFYDDELVGIMGIVRYGRAHSLMVEWEATWLDPNFRKFGVAQLGYKQVRKWTIDQGYRYAVVFIRSDNSRSRIIRERQGAVYLTTKRNEKWADGSIADVDCFILHLDKRKKTPQQVRTHAIDHLKNVLTFLDHGDALEAGTEEAKGQRVLARN